MLYSSEICANTAESSPRIRATLRMTRSVQGKGGGGPRDFHRHTSFTLAEIQFVKKRANGRICILQVTKCSTGCAINAVNQDYIPSLKAEHYGTQQ